MRRANDVRIAWEFRREPRRGSLQFIREEHDWRELVPGKKRKRIHRR
jgi:hypothetical protein